MAAVPVLWTLGWIVATLGGGQVDQHSTNVGSFGAITYTVLSGFLLVHRRGDEAALPANRRA